MGVCVYAPEGKGFIYHQKLSKEHIGCPSSSRPPCQLQRRSVSEMLNTSDVVRAAGKVMLLTSSVTVSVMKLGKLQSTLLYLTVQL